MGEANYHEISHKRDGGLLSTADGQPFQRIFELEDSIYFQCTAKNCSAIMLVREKSNKGVLVSKHNAKAHQNIGGIIKLFRMWVWWTIQSTLHIVSNVTGIPLPRYMQTVDENIPQEHYRQFQQNQQQPPNEGWISWGFSLAVWSLRYALFFVNPTWGFIIGRLIPASRPANNRTPQEVVKEEAVVDERKKHLWKVLKYTTVIVLAFAVGYKLCYFRYGTQNSSKH